MGETHAHIRTICSVAGPSCIVAFILLSLASRAFFADFDAAFATQLPLTISGDTGCLVAIVIAYAYRNRIKHETAGYLFTLSAAGLCISGLAKIGVLRLDSPISLVSGDALSAFFATTCMLLWWHIVLKEHANTHRAPHCCRRVYLARNLHRYWSVTPSRIGRICRYRTPPRLMRELCTLSCIWRAQDQGGKRNRNQQRDEPRAFQQPSRLLPCFHVSL